MIQSRPIQLDGRFVGVAVQSATTWHVVPVDPVLDDLNGRVFATAEEAERLAILVLRRAARPPSREAA